MHEVRVYCQMCPAEMKLFSKTNKNGWNDEPVHKLQERADEAWNRRL